MNWDAFCGMLASGALVCVQGGSYLPLTFLPLLE